MSNLLPRLAREESLRKTCEVGNNALRNWGFTIILNLVFRIAARVSLISDRPYY
jgi:hypothetical protein